MSDPRDDQGLRAHDAAADALVDEALGGAQADGAPGDDLLGGEGNEDLGVGEEDSLQMSTGGGMGPESYPPEDEDYTGNGANRGPQ